SWEACLSATGAACVACLPAIRTSKICEDQGIRIGSKKDAPGRQMTWAATIKEAMKIHRMGRTGLKVSEICLGTMTFGHQCDERTSFAILDKAAGQGVTFLDTADVYPVPPSPETAGRTEEIVGKWLEGRREQFVVATKCRMRVGHGPNDEGLS